jgi:hypothetical protein
MKSLEKRIGRHERAWQPETRDGMMTWSAICFFAALQTNWPDPETALRFLQAEYRSLAARWDASQARLQRGCKRRGLPNRTRQRVQ